MIYILAYLTLSAFSSCTQICSSILFHKLMFYSISVRTLPFFRIYVVVDCMVQFKISVKLFSNTIKNYVVSVCFLLRTSVVTLKYLIFQMLHVEVLYRSAL